MNLGTRDRIMRLIGGLSFAVIDFFSNTTLEVIFLLFGTWGLLTSTFGYCPFYRLVGVSTCPTTIEKVSKVSEEAPKVSE